MDVEDELIYKAALFARRGQPTRIMIRRAPNGVATLVLKGDSDMQHRFLINLSTKRGDTPPMVVEPGATVHVSGQPQLHCRLEGLIVDRRIAERFALYDLRVGSCSRFASADEPIAMTPWAVGHEHLERMLKITEYAARKGEPDADPGAAELLGSMPLLDLGIALPGQNITAVVINTSREPAIFEAAAIVRPLEPAVDIAELRHQVRAAAEYLVAVGNRDELQYVRDWLNDATANLAIRLQQRRIPSSD